MISRPWQVKASIALASAYWSASVAVYLTATDQPDLEGLGILAFWTAAAGAWFWRVWRGGPVATRRMATTTGRLGLVFLAGTIALAWITLTGPGPDDRPIWPFVPGVLGGVALIAIGRLLSHHTVRTWTARLMT